MAVKFPQKTLENLISKGSFLVSDVSFPVVEALINWILENRPHKNTFTILIDSSGGSPSAIIYFASFLSTLSEDVKLKGVAFGECGSAALALLQCCHERIAVDHCGFFIHHAETRLEMNCQVRDFAKIKIQFEQSRSREEELVRLQCKRSGISRSKWMKLSDRGSNTPGAAIFSQEALQLGLVDKIVKHYAIF